MDEEPCAWLTLNVQTTWHCHISTIMVLLSVVSISCLFQNH